MLGQDVDQPANGLGLERGQAGACRRATRRLECPQTLIERLASSNPASFSALLRTIALNWACTPLAIAAKLDPEMGETLIPPRSALPAAVLNAKRR